MSLPIHFRPTARDEYDRAIKWYEDQQPGLGVRFESCVQSILDYIASHPDFYPIARRDIRHALVYPFPYCVYYRVRMNRIVVIAVFHESRDPKEWQSRS